MMGRLYMAVYKTDPNKLEEVLKLEKEGKLGGYPNGVKSIGSWVAPDGLGFELLEVESEKGLFEYIRQWLPWMTREDVYPVLTPKDIFELRKMVPRK